MRQLNLSMLPINSGIRVQLERAYLGGSQMDTYTKETVLEVLAEMKYLCKPISSVGLQRDRPQLYTAAVEHFGSVEVAASQVQLPKFKVKSLAKQEREHNKYLLGVC
ncbi:hypothetical protein [Bacillus thuringiensis]|uniref:hypothetical protein n=1 Tax=Bacillus thuringiensis TaxID=1428 RepID=UPI000BFE5FF5|nr:hypothetical protein [Bacillus thuringiensis]PGU95933.1 hypothetical protein COD69_24880 [Bacillus thuringiensis]HEF1904306.1 hypothetical protein [Bacillus cereus]